MTLQNHIAKIQELAAQLSNHTDQKYLDPLLDAIDRETRAASRLLSLR